MGFKLGHKRAAARLASRQDVKAGLEVFLDDNLRAKKKRLYRSPWLRQFWGDEQHEFESWAELFFDLIFVAVAFKLGDGIAEVVQDKEAFGEVIPYFAAQFLPLYTLWWARTTYLSRYHVESLFHSILDAMYALMVAMMAMFIGTRGEILESFEDKDALGEANKSEVAKNFLFAAAEEVKGSSVDYNLLLGFSVCYLFCQSIHLFRCFEMGFVVAHHGVKKDHPEHLRQTQKAAVLTTSKMEVLRQIVSMVLTCIAVGAAYNGNVDLALTALSMSFFAVLGVFIIIRLKLLCIKKTVQQVPMNVSFTISRMGEFTMLMLGEGVLQIIISVVDSDNLRGHIGTFILSFGVLAQLHFMAFYIVPTEVEQHAFRKSSNAAFFIIIFYPISTGALVFVGVALKLILKKQAKLEDEENDEIRWLLSFSLFVAAITFILQDLIHAGWDEIFKKDYSKKGKKDKSWANFNHKRAAFTMIYLASPLLLLILGGIRDNAAEILSIGFGLLLFITTLGRLEKKWYSETVDEEDNDRCIKGLMTQEECKMVKKLVQMRMGGELQDDEAEVMEEGVSNVKERVSHLLKFLRNKSFQLGNSVSRTNALDSDTAEEQRLLETVDEIEAVTELIREQLESFVPGSGETVATAQEVDLEAMGAEDQVLLVAKSERKAEPSKSSDADVMEENPEDGEMLDP